MHLHALPNFVSPLIRCHVHENLAQCSYYGHKRPVPQILGHFNKSASAILKFIDTVSAGVFKLRPSDIRCTSFINASPSPHGVASNDDAHDIQIVCADASQSAPPRDYNRNTADFANLARVQEREK